MDARRAKGYIPRVCRRNPHRSVGRQTLCNLSCLFVRRPTERDRCRRQTLGMDRRSRQSASGFTSTMPGRSASSFAVGPPPIRVPARPTRRSCRATPTQEGKGLFRRDAQRAQCGAVHEEQGPKDKDEHAGQHRKPFSQPDEGISDRLAIEGGSEIRSIGFPFVGKESLPIFLCVVASHCDFFRRKEERDGRRKRQNF